MEQFNSRIIIACDFTSEKILFEFLNKMENNKLFLKLGMQFLYANGFSIIRKLKMLGHNIFIDLKIYDILNTSVAAIKSLAKYKPDFISVHSLNNLNTLIAINEAANKYKIKLLAVSILTSLDDNDLKNLGFCNDIPNEVALLIENISKAKIYGVVCSANEVSFAKKQNLISVTPGIRIKGDSSHDQKRFVTPKQAIINGADFIVIGRSITNSKNPNDIYKKIEEEIKKNDK